MPGEQKMPFQSLRSFICPFVVAATALTTLAPPLIAQDAKEFSLELNNAAETSTGGCRLTYVATNRTGQALAKNSYEVAVFNSEGVVSRILVLEFGALTDGKTKVVQFDLADQGCSDISRIVVNAVSDCELADGSGQGDFCMSALVTSSRATIQFGV
jgi:hypothetical protein